MVYPEILHKTFLKQKVTTIILVMRQCFPREILVIFSYISYKSYIFRLIFVSNELA